MLPPLFNDQAHIAEQFHLIDEHVVQSARLASFKISSYKLSLHNSSYCYNLEELKTIIKSTLLNYTDNTSILVGLGFFAGEIEN